VSKARLKKGGLSGPGKRHQRSLILGKVIVFGTSTIRGGGGERAADHSPQRKEILLKKGVMKRQKGGHGL